MAGTVLLKPVDVTRLLALVEKALALSSATRGSATDLLPLPLDKSDDGRRQRSQDVG